MEYFSIVVALETETKVVIFFVLVSQHSVLDGFRIQVEETVDQLAMKWALQCRFHLGVHTVQVVFHTDVHV